MPPESRVGGAEIAGSESSNKAEKLLPTQREENAEEDRAELSNRIRD